MIPEAQYQTTNAIDNLTKSISYINIMRQRDNQMGKEIYMASDKFNLLQLITLFYYSNKGLLIMVSVFQLIPKFGILVLV